MKNPIQPIYKAESGKTRFKKNEIVRHLLDWATERGMDLNEIACMEFTNDDRQQFAQLIGYRLRGYSELTSYVDDDAYNAAAKMAEGASENEARIEALQEELSAARTSLREPMARLFGVHPEALWHDE